MDYRTKTNEYYSRWIGEDNILKSGFHGVKFIYSSERNKIQYGYGQQFDLYVFYQDSRIIFSYGDKMIDKIAEMKSKIDTVIPIEALKQTITQIVGGHLNHKIKYIFDKSLYVKSNSRPLILAEYPQYLEFFKKANPYCKNTDWVQEYFNEMVNENLCCGLFNNNILVCCSDTPSMPYMQNEVQEIGINTLEKYKGNGYATDVCITCAKEIIKSGKCPQWSTTIDNIASQKLAVKVGFQKLANVITLTY